jgi:hypothetical protein
MKYQLFDIVVLRQEFGSRIYGIVTVGPTGASDAYLGIKLDKAPIAKCYHLGDDEILAKIGTLDGDAVKRYLSQVEIPTPTDWEIGQQFARLMARTAADATDRRRWAILGSLKPGDPIGLCRHTRRGVVVARHHFHEVLPKAQKYHFSAVDPKGTIYRWSLAAVDLAEENPPADTKVVSIASST